MDKAGAAVRLPGKNDLPFPHLPTMTPDSVHLLTRSSQMTLFRDEQAACAAPITDRGIA